MSLAEYGRQEKWGNHINGMFIGNSPRGHSDVFHSNGRGNLVYYIKNETPGWLAHELYYHGFLYLTTDKWWHDGDYRPIIHLEYKNANKGGKK